jgi:integrase
MSDSADGLRLRDLPDLVIKDGSVRFRKTPALINVRRELSKVRKRYVTFLPREGCEFLRTYLQGRLLRGEPMGPDTPVIRPSGGYDRRGRVGVKQGLPFLGRQAVSKVLREAFQAVHLEARPYLLRSYFASALLSGQREGVITDLDREFFMGRAGAISMRYTNRKDLSPQASEQLREAFRKCEPFLSTKAIDTLATQDGAELQAEVARLREEYAIMKTGLAALMATQPPGTILEAKSRDGRTTIQASRDDEQDTA